MSQPEQWGIAPDYAEDMYDQMALNETEHTSGNKNKVFAGLRSCNPGTYQWLIVVLAVGLLWGMHFNFRSAFKAVL
jgi:hypothetical protein